ncbi:MAG: hypothetical protein ACRDQZ_03765 [Mycobacteriales bacterium]
MRNKILIVGALVATTAIGVGIGVAQGAASSPDSNSRPARVAVHPSATPFKASAQTLFAVVRADGTLVRGYGVVSSSLVATTPGVYKVIFKRGVAKCAFSATLGAPGSTGGPPIGEVGVVGLFGHKAGVFVRTIDSSGTTMAAGFHLIVACPPL